MWAECMSDGTDSNRPRLGARLIQGGLCSRQALVMALAEQQELAAQGVYAPVGRILVKKGLLSAGQLEETLESIQLEALSRVRLFQSLSMDDLNSVVRKGEAMCFPDQTLLAREGERAEAFYVVVAGRVRIYRVSRQGLEVDLNVLGPGEGFGEMGLLDGDLRTSHVRTMGSVHVIRISKHQFMDLLDAHQEMTSTLVSIVSSRLYESNRRVTSAVSREKAYTRLLTQAAVNSYREFLGSGRLFDRIMHRARELAEKDGPCFVQGEQGTEIMGAALMIHERSTRQSGALLRFQAQNVGQFTARSSEAERRKGESRQMHTLFGSVAGSGSSVLGLLSVADQGTLVIDQIEALAGSVQLKLAEFLASGRFRVPDSSVEQAASVKIIATCQHDPASLVDSGVLDPRLYGLFDPEPLKIPPLRKRKKDLRIIVEHLIGIGNRRAGKAVQGIDQDAYQRIMAHDWPGNFEELETTIFRAVALASGDTLSSQDIFIGLKPAQGQASLNLLQYKPLKRFVQSGWYPKSFQITTGLFFLGMVLLVFQGLSPGGQLALDLTWGVWEPLAVLAALLLGRFWCAICPVGAAGLFISRRFSLKKEVPQFIRDKGPHLSAAGIALIIWAEVTWDLFSSPLGTVILLLVFVGLGLVSSLIFRKLVWCRHLCPLGALLGLLARCSCTEMRSNHAVCNNDCRDHACVGRHSDAGCPVLEAPFTLQSNQDCILCGQCVKLCPEDSPAFNLRIPGYELGRVRYPTTFMTVLVPVLMGTQIFRGLFSLNGLSQMTSGPQNWALLLAGLGLSSLLAAGLIALTAKVMFGPLSKADLKKGWLLNYALVPMLFAYELGYHLEVLLTRGGRVVPEVKRLLGLNEVDPTFVFSQGGVQGLQVLFVLGGACWTAMLVNQIAERHQATGQGLTLSRRWPVLVLTGVTLAMLLIQ